MNKRRFRRALALSVALAAILGTSLPAQAGSDPDGAFARMKFPGGGGLVIVSYSGATTINAGVLGLVGLGSYIVNAYSIGCNGTPTNANRLFSVAGDATSEGALFASWQVVDTGDLPSLRSIWLRTSDGGMTACGRAVPTRGIVGAETVLDGKAATSAGLQQPGMDFLVIVEALPSSRARVTVAADFDGDDTFSIRGSSRSCGSRAGTSRFLVNVEALPVYKSKVMDMTGAQFEALRSVRVKNTETGMNAGCANVTNFDITFPKG